MSLARARPFLLVVHWADQCTGWSEGEVDDAISAVNQYRVNVSRMVTGQSRSVAKNESDKL